MNDRRIYELMAVKPQIRAVQICDALDEDLTDVSTALRALVECGDVVQSKGFAPNGHPAMQYDLSAAFKESKEYRALMALMLSAAANAAPVAVPVAPPLAPDELPAESRIDLAIAYLKKHGIVTENGLRIAIGLKDGAYPIAYLTRAIKSGLLHKRADGMWSIGPGPVIAAAKPKPIAKARAPLAKPKPGPVAQFSATAQPEDAPAIDKPAPVMADVPTVLRCGLWSDGTVELQRNGRTVAAMAQGDAEFMAAFLARVRA